MYNEDLTPSSCSHKKKIKQLSEIMTPYEDEWINILTKCTSLNKRRKFVETQAGSGFGSAVGLIISLIPALLSLK